MSCIRSKDTKPELLVRKFLFSKGLRYRLHSKNLPGKPDIVLSRKRTVIFIHGCFWHGHPACKYFKIPETRREWWISKITKTQQKDAEEILQLKAAGWKVIVIYECALRPKFKDETLANLFSTLQI
jgi:DNA mismatch endonuclease (patch repair protein)